MKKLTWLVVICCLISFALAKDEIVIDLGEQTLYFIRDQKLLLVCPVTTGSGEYPTPCGQFQILEKTQRRESKEFHSVMLLAQMINRERGIFIHHGFLFGPQKEETRGSHGCIRLDFLTAKALYELTQLGCKVRIERTVPADLVDIAGTLWVTQGYYRGKTQFFYQRPPQKGFEEACKKVAVSVGNRGSTKATLNPQKPDEIPISDDLAALVIGEVAVEMLPHVDGVVKALVSQKKYKKGVMAHLVKPGKGQVEESLWFLDGGTWSVTIKMEDFNRFLVGRGLPPMTEEMFKKK